MKWVTNRLLFLELSGTVLSLFFLALALFKESLGNEDLVFSRDRTAGSSQHHLLPFISRTRHTSLCATDAFWEA